MRKTRWSLEHGSKVIAEWRRSGLSMTAFARKRGVTTERLRYWRDRVEEAVEHELVVPKVVPGVVVGLGAARISMRLPRGVVVEATSSDDLPAAWLAELAFALESN